MEDLNTQPDESAPAQPPVAETSPADAAPDAQVTANTDDAAAPPAADTAPPAADTAPQGLVAELEQGAEHVVEEIEHAGEVVVDMLSGFVHEVEHRSFGRPSADHPMPVTTIRRN